MTTISGSGVAHVGGGGGGLTHGATINNLTTANQAIANNTAADFTMSNIVWDTDGYATGASVLTVPAGLAGVYLITCTAALVAASTPSTGYLAVELYATTNGDLAFRRIPWQEFTNAGLNTGVNFSVVAKLPAGDVIECFATNHLGVSVSALGSAGTFWYQSLSAVYLHS